MKDTLRSKNGNEGSPLALRLPRAFDEHGEQLKGELNRRQRTAWAAFGPPKKPQIAMHPGLRAHPFDSIVLAALCYASKVWPSLSTPKAPNNPRAGMTSSDVQRTKDRNPENYISKGKSRGPYNEKISLKTNSGQEIRKYIKVAIGTTQVPNCAILPISPPMDAATPAADSPRSGVENKADTSPYDSTAAVGHEEPVQHTGESITIADDEELPESAEQTFPSNDLERIPTAAAPLGVPYQT
ncbi:unnamed protein product [Strongylus vulgaris]|uniref:Uncharacterized protein n=1 Tax=Strongylus vulgaris TaxID=40348 RepID=A0A3P7JHW5_STRVU|nr:unnamed protein product [Strongylus vulgaris]